MLAPRSEPPLQDVLRGVSRSFYLSLRLLPAATRGTVGLAYLLARAADTVADTRLVARARRAELLEDLAASCGVGAAAAAGRERPGLLAELAGLARTADASEDERRLLARAGECLAALEALPPLEARLVREVLATIVSGMRDDLLRFPGEDERALAALETRADLDRYCWQVAGCVGEFWSRLHAARLPALLRWLDPEAWAGAGRRFGRLLQLTNVLRDAARDLRHGRCYLPRADLSPLGLVPADLLRPTSWPRLRPLYLDLVRGALADGEAGLAHTLAVRPRAVGLRLAGLVPLLLALDTLGLTLAGNPLDPQARLKVPRRRVYAHAVAGFLAARHDRALVSLYRRVLREAGLEWLRRSPRRRSGP